MLWNIKVVDFVCRKCSGTSGNAEENEDVTLDGHVKEKVTNFWYLGDGLDLVA